MNHITYRGYYRDEESGFYYLQSRYYDPDVCRFVNADDVNVLIESCKEETDNIFEYNNYIYCNSDPISYTDASGYSVKEWVNNQVGLSDFSIIHSGKDNIAFNCYGYALNIYSGYSLSRLNPGKISNRDYPFSSKIKSITIDEMAKLGI